MEGGFIHADVAKLGALNEAPSPHAENDGTQGADKPRQGSMETGLAPSSAPIRKGKAHAVPPLRQSLGEPLQGFLAPPRVAEPGIHQSRQPTHQE